MLSSPFDPSRRQFLRNLVGAGTALGLPSAQLLALGLLLGAVPTAIAQVQPDTMGIEMERPLAVHLVGRQILDLAAEEATASYDADADRTVLRFPSFRGG